MDKKKTIIVSIALVLMLIFIASGASYAYFNQSINATDKMNVQVQLPACLGTTLTSSSSINLTGDNSLPISDRKIINSTGKTNYRYDFTVSNNCGSSQNVDIVLAATTASSANLLSSLKYILVPQGTTIKLSDVAFVHSKEYNLQSNVKGELESIYASGKTFNTKAYKLKTGETIGTTSKKYSLYIWVDLDENGLGNNATFNNTFEGYVASVVNVA